MTTVSAPGFYAATAAQTWGSVPLTPVQSKAAIPAELQSGAKLYTQLFPPPKPGSFWQEYAPVIASIAIFVAGAGALSMLGAGAASGAAGSTVASAATSTTAAATGGTVSQAAIDSAWSAMQASGGYIGPTLGISGAVGTAGAVGTGASILSQVSSALKSSGLKQSLGTVAKNLIMSRLPSGTRLTPSEQAMLDNMIQGQQSKFAAALETPQPGYSMTTPGYSMATTGSAASSKTSTYLMYGVAGIIALKLAGIL